MSNKKIRVLIAPLASSDLPRLQRCLHSIETQLPTDDLDIEIEFDISVVLNSKNMNFAIETQKVLRDRYDTIITQSDGTPGTGKNSVFDYFRKKNSKEKVYDYLFQIDGDDFIYPCALRRLSKALSEEGMPDVLSFQSMDWLSTNFTDKMSHAPIIPNKLWLYSWCDNEVNLREIPEFKYVTSDDFATGGRIFTPGTTMWLSHKFLTEHANVKHTNKISLFEDYLFYLKLFKLHLDGHIHMAHTNHSFIYVYDKTNEDSVSTENCFYGPKELNMLRGFVEKNNMMDKHPKDDMPFVTLGKIDDFELEDKIIWCRYMIDKFPAKMRSQTMDEIKQRGYNKGKKNPQQMMVGQPIQDLLTNPK